MRRECKSPIFLGRLATILLGIIVLGFGLHSHFQSFWVQKDANGVPNYISTCETARNADPTMPINCPSISLEQYYIVMVIICFSLSVVGTMVSCLVDLKSHPFIRYDFGYHAVAAIFLMIAASVYITSSEQVYIIYKLVKVSHPEFNIRRGEKILTSIFTIIQAFVYGYVAFMIASGS